MELIYVETLLDVMNLLAGQQLLPLLPEVEMIEESMVTTRDFNHETWDRPRVSFGKLF